MNSSISTQARDSARPLSSSLTRLAHTMSPTVPTMSASTSCARILCTCGALDYTLTSGFRSLAISLPQHRKVRRLCFLRTDSCWCLGVLTFMMLSAPGLPRTLTCPHSPSHRHPSLLPSPPFTPPSLHLHRSSLYPRLHLHRHPLLLTSHLRSRHCFCHPQGCFVSFSPLPSRRDPSSHRS